MAMTETRPATVAAQTQPDQPPPVESAGAAGWLSTSDHKRLGRFYVAFSLVFGLVATVLGTLSAAERIDSGFDIVDADVYLQLFTSHHEAALWLFLVPLLLGLATFVVPLQVGAGELAFPRGAATALWGYLVGGGLLVGAYAADGGPSGGDAVAVDLHLLALLALTASLGLAVICLMTTVLTYRAPGMTLDRVPAFSWSVLVAGGLCLLTAPVLVARLIGLFVTHHYGGDYAFADWFTDVAWVFRVPQVYLVAVPAAGAVLEIVPVLGRNRLRHHGAALVVLGLLGIVGLGAWAQVPSTFDEVLYVAMGLAAVVPALALLALVGDTLRNGRPVLRAPLLLAVGSVLLLLLGALAGALSVIDGLDLRGTVWEEGQFELVVLGAAWLGGLAGLWWWAPKLYGTTLPDGPGVLAFLAVFGGTLAVAVAHLVNGLAEDAPLVIGTSPDEGVTGLEVLATIGSALQLAGALLVVLVVVRAATRRRDADADADPWGGATLEWATGSPPAAGNFTVAPPLVTSPTPLLDETPA
jgi:heme/copper-type cytochrome/quinol oxidase subunit 1